MHSIIDSNYNSPHLEPFRLWLNDEWEGFAPFSKPTSGLPIPAPLLAIEDDELLGGLAFSRYKNPKNDELALWINAILVDPAQRGKGIASALISVAEKSALDLDETQIFALTDVPKLYQNQGWSVFNIDGKNRVMTKQL